jgi:hypothetical protein
LATTLAGRAFTEVQRLGQLRIRARTIRDVLAVWPLLSVEDLEGTWKAFEVALLAIVGVHSAESARVAAEYYRSFRYAEGISGTPTVRIAALPETKEVVRSLRYVGLVSTQKLLEAQRADAARVALTNVSGDVSRHVLNRGRDTLIESVAADQRALGWARVTDSKPCSWCRMLASRGPVYRSKGGGFKAHAHCGCSAEPVYSEDQPWPGRAQEFKQQWDETTKGLSGAEARKAFRQAVEGRTPTPT